MSAFVDINKVSNRLKKVKTPVILDTQSQVIVFLYYPPNLYFTNYPEDSGLVCGRALSLGSPWNKVNKYTFAV